LNLILVILFNLFSLVNGVVAFFAIFPLLGMMTNANGFLSGQNDMLFLMLILGVPACLVLSGILYTLLRARLAGLLVAAIPSLAALWFYATGLPF
jgi:hypothetical protein